MNRKLAVVIGILLLIPALIKLDGYIVYNVRSWEYYEVEQAKEVPFIYVVYRIENDTRIVIKLVDDLGEALNITCSGEYSKTTVKSGIYNQWMQFRVTNYNTVIAEEGTVILPQGGLVEPYFVREPFQLYVKISGLAYFRTSGGVPA